MSNIFFLHGTRAKKNQIGWGYIWRFSKISNSSMTFFLGGGERKSEGQGLFFFSLQWGVESIVFVGLGLS
jgi:hypothetical protein